MVGDQKVILEWDFLRQQNRDQSLGWCQCSRCFWNPKANHVYMDVEKLDDEQNHYIKMVVTPNIRL